MLQSPWISLIALALMICATWFGGAIRRHWPEHHTNRETIELLQSTVMLLATFAAIVLGLLLTSAKSQFDDIENDVRSFSATIIELDYSLEQLGTPGIPIRQQLARYTAAAIAGTWKDQPPPPGNYYPILRRTFTPGISENSPILGQMLEQVNSSLRALPSTSTAEAHLQEASQRLMNIAIAQRWRIVEASMGNLSTPFFAMLVFWLIVIYLCFGLSAPFNRLSFVVTALSALALSSALFVIIDLYTPYDGIFTVSSAPQREGLSEMLRLPNGMPPPWPTGCKPAAQGC